MTVPLLNDNAFEDTEFINLTLTSVDIAAVLNPSTARIYIKDVVSELILLQFHSFAHTLQIGRMEAKPMVFV